MTFCENCGQPVTSKFCSKCGHPAPGGGADANGAVLSVPLMATPPVSTPSSPALSGESYDCFVCELSNRSCLKTMKPKLSSGMATVDYCGECFAPIPKEVEYFKCRSVILNRTKHHVYTSECDRKLCRACIDRSRFLREHSRYHKNDTERKTSLCDCCSDPKTSCCAVLEMYNVMAAGQCYRPITGDQAAIADNPMLWCLAVPCVGVSVCGYPQLLIADMFCCTVPCVHFQQQQLRDRFGVEPAPLSHLLFCRWCVVAQSYREAVLRGYPQQFCPGGSPAERRLKMVPPPPGVPRQSAGTAAVAPIVAPALASIY